MIAIHNRRFHFMLKKSFLENKYFRYLSNLMFISFFICFFNSLNIHASSGKLSKKSLSISEAVYQKKYVDQGFRQERTLDEYIETFGESFRNMLNEVNKNNGVWLDGGSGSARFFIQSMDQYPNMKRIGCAPNVPVNHEEILKLDEQYKQLFNYYLETVEDLNIAVKVDMITDVFGAMSYTDDVSAVMCKYLAMLNVGGKIFLNTSYVERNDNELLKGLGVGTFFAKGKKILSFKDYLDTVKGIQLEILGRNVVVITKTNKKNHCPKTKHIETHDIGEKPPYRIFNL
jgi:hypothetical protein